MPTSPQSLLSYLTAPNPQLDVGACVSGRNTRSTSKRNPWDSPKRIEKWQDFEYDALQSMYGGNLRQILEQHFELDDFTIPSLPFCQIRDENSLESVIIKWNQTVTTNALSAAQESSQHLPYKDKIFMCKGGQALWPQEMKRHPDWAGVKNFSTNRGAGNPAINILPGDTKLGSKWSSKPINQGTLDDDEYAEDWMQPLAQVFTYCVRSNARYGYLITDQELVVIRIRPIMDENNVDSQNSFQDIKKIDPRKKDFNPDRLKATTPDERARNSGCLEYRSIPWYSRSGNSADGSPYMTVNLALWWLHMMAAKDHAIADEYCALREPQGRIDTKSQSSRLVNSQSSGLATTEGSQEGQPLAEKTSNLPLKALTLEARRTGGKRTREDDRIGEESDYIEQQSPQKRKTRGRG